MTNVFLKSLAENRDIIEENDDEAAQVRTK